MSGLGMAETTPGPLIQVVQFVGFLGAWRAAAPLPPLMAAVLGSLLTAWVTFTPCFLWIFLGAPHVERLRGRRGLDDALGAITAAVVGVILQLALWFALHVLFGTVRAVPLVAAHPALGHLWLPDLATLDVGALVIALLAALLLFRTRAGMLGTLAAAIAAGALWRWWS
jgi:chromate transporter